MKNFEEKVNVKVSGFGWDGFWIGLGLLFAVFALKS